jgi:hypothetical protein
LIVYGSLRFDLAETRLVKLVFTIRIGAHFCEKGYLVSDVVEVIGPTIAEFSQTPSLFTRLEGVCPLR